MKASFESIKASGTASLVVRQFEEQRFSSPYHFHPEFELTLIIKGQGKRYVGTHMNDYSNGDLVLLGSNLPHCWKTDPFTSAEKSISIVVHFQENFLGQQFFLVPEMNRVRHLLSKSSHGIRFTGNTRLIQQKIQSLPGETDGFRKLMKVLDILHDLAVTRQYKLLDKQHAQQGFSLNEQERVHAAMAYIVENFQQTISLKAVAANVNMTPESFCKYFKKITRKTFIEVVNDYRIDFALGQLVNTEKPVAQVGFESGFNDISNFYKTFKDRTGVSPLNYRKSFVLSR